MILQRKDAKSQRTAFMVELNPDLQFSLSHRERAGVRAACPPSLLHGNAET